MQARLLTVNKLIYALLGFYLVAKDPLYQLQAFLFQDIVLKMAYVKLSLLLLAILIIPFYFARIRLSGSNCLLLLFVAYNFCAIAFINNDFPLLDRFAIFYISMFLPLFLVVINLFGIEPGRLPRWTTRFIFSGFVLFTVLDCLVGLWQPIQGPNYYEPLFSVSLLGVMPSKVVTIKGQTRSLGFFLDGIQHGLFLNFSLFFFLSLVWFQKKYVYLLLVTLVLANIYLTYTRSIYVFSGLNLALMALIVMLRRKETVFKRLLLRNFWLISLICGALIYIYGLTMGESDATKSLFIRFESARFILDNLTASLHKLLFGIGFIQNELFENFVPDNFFLALASYGGIVALMLFMAIYANLNGKIIKNMDALYDKPIFLASYLLFVNVMAFGMFCNYLDTIFMFMTIPIIHVMALDMHRVPALKKSGRTMDATL